jgi:nucleotide-binding universal stress UspA family protein
VGVDGSPASVAALRWAIHEASLTRSTVEAVNAWTGSVSPFDNIAIAQAGYRSERDAAHDVLLTAVAEARKTDHDGHVPVEEALAPGHPAAVLRDKGRHARLVVLGSPRKGRLTGLLHKSVVQSVIKDAPCRVVVVAADGSLVSDTALPSAST